MTPQALKALKESIEHWERLAAGKRNPHESVGADGCALCRVFNPCIMDNGFRREDRCNGCPVAERTGKQFCFETPWDMIGKAIDEHGDEETTRNWLDNDPEARVLAAAELAFLKSLLPDSENKACLRARLPL
jgi:hypothetical protein